MEGWSDFSCIILDHYLDAVFFKTGIFNFSQSKRTTNVLTFFIDVFTLKNFSEAAVPTT